MRQNNNHTSLSLFFILIFLPTCVILLFFPFIWSKCLFSWWTRVRTMDDYHCHISTHLKADKGGILSKWILNLLPHITLQFQKEKRTCRWNLLFFLAFSTRLTNPIGSKRLSVKQIIFSTTCVNFSSIFLYLPIHKKLRTTFRTKKKSLGLLHWGKTVVF